MQLYAISSLQPRVMSTISPFTQLLILFFLENLCGAQRSLPGCFLLVDFNLRKILTLDILWNKGVTVVDWCYMCKRSGESVNHLLLHCLIASEWWTLVWALFGLLWVMPQSVRALVAVELKSYIAILAPSKHKKTHKTVKLNLFFLASLNRCAL